MSCLVLIRLNAQKTPIIKINMRLHLAKGQRGMSFTSLHIVVPRKKEPFSGQLQPQNDADAPKQQLASRKIR